MDLRRVFIMAGGRQVRWGNRGQGHESKHMTGVPNRHEYDDPRLCGSSVCPLMWRTLDQLHAFQVGFDNLIDSVTINTGQPLAGGPAWTAEDLERRFRATYDFSVMPNVGEACFRIANREFGGARRLVFLMGDVYWTGEDMRRLLLADGEIPSLATDGWDTFGFSFHANSAPGMLDVLTEWGKTNKLRAGLDSRAIRWEALWCRTWTQDFDIDFEHVQFMHGVSKNNIFRDSLDQVNLRAALRRQRNPKKR